MNANKLKAAAAEFMADRMKGQDTLGEIEALKAEIERLKARSTVPPVQDSTPEEIEAALQAADDAYDALSDEELKQTIADRFGSRPKDNPGRDTRSEEHTSELQSLMRISYAVFCLKKKNTHS